MVRDYSFKEIEAKWQEYWDQNKTFKVTEDPDFPKDKRMYSLDMFPYPSGSGLHVGHPEGYTASDIMSRYYRMKGYNVIHPMGFDSFGLPAENYAIKTGTHPKISTETNIKNFTRQIKMLGFSYDWDREVSTHKKDYYKWTQWIFLQLFKDGLAYEDNIPINWCNSCKTGLANEEVKDGKCDRCGSPVVKKDLRQWMLKITAYADRLLEDLDTLDWSESIKTLQRNWIGRSEGAEVDFGVKDSDQKIRVYTTRPDTIFGATYMVLAPEHPLVEQITTPEQKETVQSYIKQARLKSDLERTELNKDKTGIFTGAYALNPVNGREIPIWISDYVLISYGTGAIMAVPAHDDRDFEFAKKFNLEIIQVVSKDGQPVDLSEQAFTEKGVAINSGEFDGTPTEDFKLEITKWLEEKGVGQKAVNYKLRDWVFSRQRFWGEPIPVVHCEKCGVVPLPESDLPLTLPEITSFKPTGTGDSPLAVVEDWVNTTCPSCGGPAKRETNTMPQWAGSCWYYLRYLDPHNTKEFVSKEAESYWMPVDLYIGGAEHAVLHLLYARFWHKFLYDHGYVSTSEPFLKLRNQGIILGENGEKMSKSRGNVVNPDIIVEAYGADAMRLYEMFMGPLDVMKPWKTQGLTGITKFLHRLWRLYTEFDRTDNSVPQDILKLTHKTIKKVSQDIESINSFNTAISQMMVLVNELSKQKVQYTEVLEILAKLVSPFAPHISEELWEMLGHIPSVSKTAWPSYDENLTIDNTITVVFQVNGKVRDQAEIARGTGRGELETMARKSSKIQKWISDKKILKVIAVPDKLINFVVK